MYPIRKFPSATFAAALACALAAALAPAARANVYATNIKLNGAMNNITNAIAGSVNISFVLNEPATLGTVVQVFSGANVVRSITNASGGPGALKGANTVVWDGRGDTGSLAPGGAYSVSITAAASGFTNWTQTSTDTNAGYYVFSASGMAVNTKTNSPYYGRVFVGNGINNGSGPGDADGILKANADGSLADEGQSTGGFNWVSSGPNLNPRFLRYGQDDRIYALDLNDLGIIVAFDMVMSTNQTVLNANNYSDNQVSSEGGVGWGVFDVTEADTTNGRLWLGDSEPPNGGAGLWTWHMTNGIADPNDTMGTQAVAPGGVIDSSADGGSMMDLHSNIFVGQCINESSDPSIRVMEFTNWDGVTAFTNSPAWQAGASDDTFRGNFDLALDSRANPKYIALCMCDTGALPAGLRVLNATNGLVVTNGTQILTNLDQTNFYEGVAWDAVGNLYGATGNPGVSNKWRVFSPPGTNQATTVAIETIQQMGSSTPPTVTITNITVNGSTVTIDFTALASDLPSAFTLQSATNVTGLYGDVSGAGIILLSPGAFRATTATSGTMQFYRIKR